MTVQELISLLLRAEPSYEVRINQVDLITGDDYSVTVEKVQIDDHDREVQINLDLSTLKTKEDKDD